MMTDKIETLQNMIDEDDARANEFLTGLIDELDAEGGNDDELRQLTLLEWLRTNGDSYGPDDIEQASYDDCMFNVNPHSTKDGTSPEKARKLVGQLRDSLAKIKPRKPFITSDHDEFLVYTGGELWDRSQVNHYGYKIISQWLREDCPDDLKVGINDVLNTLYFVSSDTDGDSESAKDHRDTIREAFDGGEIEDRRTSRQTSDAEYMVCTDEEADDRWNDSLESYLDDGGVEGADGKYFDRDAWKRDAKADGRGHSLNGYDGTESEHRKYFIYRTN